MHIMLLKP